jgi:hypothetical protein
LCFWCGRLSTVFALCASHHASHHLFASKVDSTGLGSANLMGHQFFSHRRQNSGGSMVASKSAP